jgi:xanthine dehydrogenase YagT iron-sulfur-binding subunit
MRPDAGLLFRTHTCRETNGMRDRDDAPRTDQTRSGPGFNRREFLKGSGAAVAATAMATSVAEAAPPAAPAKSNVVPARPVPVSLNINGKTHQLELEPRVTLLEALRTDLNLTGAKEVCTTTNCGACTVLVDGKPVYACARLAVECQGKQIRTVEGLTSGSDVDSVIRAFVKHDASQCGFCTPGFVVTVRAFVDAHPGASLDDIRKGLGGNICRCGTYHGVAQAALECCGGASKGGN